MTVSIYKNKINQEILDLLFIADPSQDSINEYLNDSIRFSYTENNVIAGFCVIQSSYNSAEIKNISVKKEFQNKGIGSKLINFICEYCCNHNLVKLTVGTGNSSIRQLAFYQKHGFRIKNIIPDYFLRYPEPIYENNIQCLDMIILEKSILE